MALWKDPSVKDSVPGDAPGSSVDAAARAAEARTAPVGVATTVPEAPRRPVPAPAPGSAKESLIAADAAVLGADEGEGNVVSLGVFTEPRRAAEAATIARMAGFEPRTVERTREADLFWLDIDRQASGGLPTVEQLGAGDPARVPRLELRRCPIP